MLQDPRILGLFCVFFIGLGVFNFVLGQRRERRERANGRITPWYRQMGILTGTEYVSLGIVLLLHLGILTNFFPGSIKGIIVPLYTLGLILAGLVLCAILFFGFQAMRPRRTGQAIQSVVTQDEDESGLSAEQRALQVQKRRERRQKAAVARRRRAGRA